MMVRDGSKPAFAYKRSTLPGDVTIVEGTKPMSVGPHRITADFAYDGGGMGMGGLLTLKVDGVSVGKARIEHTAVMLFSCEGADIGHDTETQVLAESRSEESRVGKASVRTCRARC